MVERSRTRNGWVNWLAGTCLLLAAGVGEAQKATAAPRLDLDRFMGSWFEIARLPDKEEKQCVGGALVLYTAAYKANHFAMVSSCLVKGGNTDSRNASGERANKNGDGRLKTSYWWLFSHPYWVLATGPQYEWALVGTPNHKTLWVLSRTASLSPEVLAEVETTAALQGFDRTKLMMVPQRQQSR